VEFDVNNRIAGSMQILKGVGGQLEDTNSSERSLDIIITVIIYWRVAAVDSGYIIQHAGATREVWRSTKAPINASCQLCV